MLPKPLAIAIVCIITVVWLGNFAAQFIVSGYQVDGWIHSIFLTIVGGAFALSRKDGGGGPNPPEPPSAPAGPDLPPLPEPPASPRPSGAHRANLFIPRSVTT